jgi:hypothetical protein
LVRTSVPPGRSTDRARVVVPEGRVVFLTFTSVPPGRSTDRTRVVAPDGFVVVRVFTVAPDGRVVVVRVVVVFWRCLSCAENSVVAASFAEANDSGAVIAAQANAPAASMLDIRIMSVLFSGPAECRAKTRSRYPPPSASAQ